MNSWGVLGKPTPEKIQEYMNMPYGKFKELVTDINRQTKGKPLRRYSVEVQDIQEVYRSVFVDVQAATGDQAIKLAQMVDKDTLNWSEAKTSKYNKYSYRVSQVWD